ncbi:hypothetical protein CWC17_16610 [Pseudoalteromonas sp. S3785]|uniref:EpsG family protein n=1 Tax=Pseudoalteromonas sp. S3785 TaxID=579545 RepID=UPI00110BD6A0|nr:EpsG family protein [Pseudoalteromonas sp. S3785]TMO71470.1 hypothetical protein CWC17_16610 [Pseudoalteromonas sp. S3785]
MFEFGVLFFSLLLLFNFVFFLFIYESNKLAHSGYNRNNLLLIGVALNLFTFIFYLNTLDYNYSDDYLQYINWFKEVSVLSRFEDLQREKDVGFSFLLYLLSRVSVSPIIFTFLLSIFIITFVLWISKFAKGESGKLEIVFVLLTIMLLNRMALEHYFNIIRSFISTAILIFIIFKCLERKYLWLLLIPAVFFVHKMQFLLFFSALFFAKLLPLRLILLILITGFLNVYTGISSKVIAAELVKYVSVIAGFYSNAGITGELVFSTSKKIQVGVYIIVPLSFLYHYAITGWKFAELIECRDEIILKYIFIVSSAYFLLVSVFPVADRFTVILLPLLYVMFLKYVPWKIIWFYAIFIIAFNFVALIRNSGYIGV